MSYKLIIFDFDGTLANTLDWFQTHINIAAQKYRFRELKAEDHLKLRHLSAKQIIKFLGISWWKQPFIAKFMRSEMNKDLTMLRLHPHTRDILLTLSSKTRIMILSSNSEENVKGMLGPDLYPGISDFECGISLFGKAGKIKKAIKKYKCLPEEVIYIGDEIRDIEAAKDAGIHSGFVTWGYTLEEAVKHMEAHMIFRSPEDLLRKL